jgi:hypothetical protein
LMVPTTLDALLDQCSYTLERDVVGMLHGVPPTRRTAGPSCCSRHTGKTHLTRCKSRLDRRGGLCRPWGNNGVLPRAPLALEMAMTQTAG